MQTPNSKLSFSTKLSFFMDPMKVINNYKTCRLNPSKSKVDNMSLGTIYKYVTENELQNAHFSLVDAKAQTAVVCFKYFIQFINKTISIKTIDGILQRKEQLEIQKSIESTRPVHHPWIELTSISNSDFEWTTPRSNQYVGTYGRGKHGPSNAVTEVARTSKLLEDIFFFFFLVPISLFQKIVSFSNYYAFE